jgi:hypothetical protein
MAAPDKKKLIDTFHNNLDAFKSFQEKTALQHQIENTDKQIDQLVYKLYGLTEARPPKVYRRRKEIKIVEESVKLKENKLSFLKNQTREIKIFPQLKYRTYPN